MRVTRLGTKSERQSDRFHEARHRHPRSSSIFSGNRLDTEKRRGGMGMLVQSGRRFCETCQRHKPRGNRPAMKGWQCDDCLQR